MIDNLPDRYEIRKTLGAGRFATVYHAYDRELQRDVALKVSALANRESTERGRLKRELRISCKLRHPSIASGFDGFEQDSHVVLSLPLLTGGTLQQVPGKSVDSQRLNLRRFIAICDAVQYVHRNGLLHADIKPENVMLDEGGQPFLTDFGSAMTIKQPTSDLVGTPAYLAPELVRGEATPSIATDVYALGATLFCLLIGQPPFDGDPHAILQAIRTLPFPRVRKHNTAVDRSLEAIIAVACHANPQSRYASADALRSDVERFLEDRPIAAKKVGPVGRTWLLAKRNPTSAALITALVAVVLVGTVVSTIGWIRSESQRRALDQSTLVFEKQSKQAAEHEASLQLLLTTINAEQKSIEAATANEVKFRAEAEAARDQALQASQLAKARLLEAQKLSSMADTLKNTSGEMDLQIVQTEKLIRQQGGFNAELKIRIDATNSMVAACKAMEQKQWDDAAKILDEIPIQFKDSTFERLTRLVAKHNTHAKFAPLNNSRRGDVKRVVFTRDASKAIVLTGGNLVELIEFDKFGAHTSTVEQKVESFANARTPENAAFDATGKKVAIAYQSKDNNHVVVVRNTHDLGSDNKIFDIKFSGSVSAIRFDDQGRIFVIRNNVATKDIEIFDVQTSNVVWSCRESRRQAAEADSPSDDAGLLPLFVEVGTRSWEHVLFASSPKPTAGAPTRVFLHSVDLRSQLKVRTLDCGMQDLSRWPHRWYLSEHINFGLGQKCLATQDPPMVTNPRYANVDRRLGKQDQFALCKCMNGWQPILNRPDEALKSRFLEAGLFQDWSLPELLGNERGKSPDSLIPTPRLDTFTGRLIYSWVVFDLISQQSIPLRSSFTKGLKAPPDFIAIDSEQRNSTIAIKGDQIQACFAYDWNPDAFRSVDAMNQWLATVANRLREAAITGPLLANSQQVGANGSENKSKSIQASGGYIDCQTGSDGFSLPSVRMDDRSAKTFEAVVSLDAIKRTEYPSIVASNIGLALKFDPQKAEFYIENPATPETKTLPWVGVFSGPVSLQQWIHVAGCFDGIDRFSMYVNGKKTAEKQLNYIPNANRSSTDLVVNAGGSLFGKVDAVRVSETRRYTEDFEPSLPLRSDDSTIALYQFDEQEGNTVVDYSGNGNHGWIENPIRGRVTESTFQYEAPKIPIAASGYALKFDQASNLVFANDIEIKENEPITVQAIVRLDEQAPEKNYNAIFNHSQFEIKATPSRQIAFGHQTRWGERTVFNDVICPALIHNRWLHVAGCWDGVNALSLYIDGQFVGKKLVKEGQSDLPARGGVYVGGYSSRRAMGGYVDSVCISKGVLYTNSFVPTLPFVADDKTMLLLDFNEGNGVTMKDRSGQGHNATSEEPNWIAVSELKDEPYKALPSAAAPSPTITSGPATTGTTASSKKTKFQPPNPSVKPGYHRLTLVGRDIDVHELSISTDGIRSVRNSYSWPLFEVNGVSWDPKKQNLLSEINGQKLIPDGALLGASDITMVYVPELVLVKYHVTKQTIEFGFAHPPIGVGDCCVIIDIPLQGTYPADAVVADVKWLTDWDAKFYSYTPKKNDVRPDTSILKSQSAIGGFVTSNSQIIFDSRLQNVTEEIAKKFPADYSVIAAQRKFQAEDGTYRLETVADDGIRVWIDDELRIDNWQGQSTTQKIHDFKLSNGSHTIRFEYFDVNSWSGLYVNLRRLK